MHTPRQTSSRIRPSHCWSEPRTTDLQTIRKDLINALHSAFPVHTTPYKRVICVLVHFSKDNGGDIKSLQNELAQVFVHDYGYEVKQVTLTFDPGLELAK
jgi:hypothetical protein